LIASFQLKLGSQLLRPFSSCALVLQADNYSCSGGQTWPDGAN
jgi:hypothetical protein